MRGLEHGGASRHRLVGLGLALGVSLHPRAGPHQCVDGAQGLFGVALLGDTVASTLPSLQPPAESGAAPGEAGLVGVSARPARMKAPHPSPFSKVQLGNRACYSSEKRLYF